MLSRMLNKETGEETVLLEKNEVDSLNEKIETLEKQLKQAQAFYRLCEIELDLYKSSLLCQIALSLTLFFKKLFGGEI